ncbi:MAG: hypothetical protein BJ554DRAFT_3598, partial [Olpidium bornovanus]
DGSAVTNEVAVKDGKVDLAPGEENPAGDIADITQLKDAIVTTSVAPLSPAHKRPTDATTNLSAVASILRGDLDAHAAPLAISEVAVENERVNLTTAGTDVTNNMPEIAHLKDATTETPAAPSIPVNDPQVVADAAPLATSEAAQGKAKETENPPPKREVEPNPFKKNRSAKQQQQRQQQQQHGLGCFGLPRNAPGGRSNESQRAAAAHQHAARLRTPAALACLSEQSLIAEGWAQPSLRRPLSGPPLPPTPHHRAKEFPW